MNKTPLIIISTVLSFALFFAYENLNSVSGQNQSSTTPSSSSGNNTSQNQTSSSKLNQSQAQNGPSQSGTIGQAGQSQSQSGAVGQSGQGQSGQGQGNLVNQIQKQLQVNEANQTGRSQGY
jgi:hypothetical protein